MAKRVSVTRESDSGRNLGFHDNRTGTDMTRVQFVSAIQRGEYENYHVRNINNVKTPVSNPDGRSSNNLN